MPLLVASLLFGACSDDTHSCTLKACIGRDVELALVDEAGGAVAATGEYRVSSPSTEPLTAQFDCTDTADDARCRDGVVVLSSATDAAAVVELRYELEPGTYTEWERVEIQYTEQTDPDFNGPGCPCTWYDGADRSTLVPEAARRPLPLQSP